MTYFAGLDASLEETAICVVDETGRILEEMRAASEPSDLISALTALGLPLERVGLAARRASGGGLARDLHRHAVRQRGHEDDAQ